jgi:hypothetical protein
MPLADAAVLSGVLYRFGGMCLQYPELLKQGHIVIGVILEGATMDVTGGYSAPGLIAQLCVLLQPTDEHGEVISVDHLRSVL